MIFKIFLLALGVLTILTAAAPTELDTRQVPVLYPLRCNKDALNQDDFERALAIIRNKKLAQCGTWPGNRIAEECSSAYPQCVRITLRALDDAPGQCDTLDNIIEGAREIWAQCREFGGSGPSTQNYRLIIHVHNEWV